MQKKIRLGKCLNCDKDEVLQNSHAINKTFFREISKKCIETHGRLLQIEFGNMFAKLDGDQLTTLQMCKACENLFNSKYENYSVKLLKDQLGLKKRETKKYICYSNVNHEKISKFLLSIFWKISNSDHKYLKNVHIFPQNANLIIRDYLNSDKPVSDIDCNLKIFKIRDNSYNLSDDYLKQIIMTPFFTYSQSMGGMVWRMIFYSYMFELSFKNISHNKKIKERYLKDGIGSLYVSFVELSEIKEFNDFFFGASY